ncbi:MAG: hypothetical protein J6T57_03200 [Alphaproteobacteria bacterium]|nr:hypothetical protein [Alphaproteobacteria bacterium]
MPGEKKLFFGVDPETLEKQEQIAAKKSAADAKRKSDEEAAKQAATERAEILQKVGVNSAIYKKDRSKAIGGSIFGVGMGIAFWLCLSFFVNGFIDAFKDKDVGGPEWTKSVVNPFVDGKFAPTATWYRQIAFLLVSLCIAIGTQHAYGSNYYESRKCVRTVDMMLNLEKFGAKYNLNKRQVKKLVKELDFIISHLATEKRIYFDMLMNGEINIKDNKTFMDMAVAIMMGHLESHPEDAQLILDTFEEKSLPDDLLRKCQYKVKQQSH